MAKKDKTTRLKESSELSHKTVIVEDKKELQLSILQLTEQKVENKFTDIALDRENEIIELLGGGQTTLKKLREEKEEAGRILARHLQEYSKKFPQEFYVEIYRLHGWAIPEKKISRKPWSVGRYTNQVIYARFSKEILPALQHLNPYIVRGSRKYKHFQWLTEDGRNKLSTFIEEATTLMKECSNWYEFRIKHSAKYGVPFQLSLMPNNYTIIDK